MSTQVNPMIQVNVLILDEPIYLDGQGPDPVVANALQLIGQLDHLELADFTVEQLVRRLPVTRRTLDRRFHAATGMTVLEKVNRQRLERAKTLLRETDLQVKAVVFLRRLFKPGAHARHLLEARRPAASRLSGHEEAGLRASSHRFSNIRRSAR